jgi:hypothetical protein
MTVSTTGSKSIGMGNGATVAWPFTFKVIDHSSVVVTYTNTAGVDTTLTLANYDITFNSNGIGGTVTYPRSASSAAPIPVGSYLTIQRIVALAQPTDIVNQGSFNPVVLENGLDNLELQIQQIAEVATRAIVFPPSNLSPTQLPGAAARANRLIGFDANGNLYLAYVCSLDHLRNARIWIKARGQHRAFQCYNVTGEVDIDSGHNASSFDQTPADDCVIFVGTNINSSVGRTSIKVHYSNLESTVFGNSFVSIGFVSFSTTEPFPMLLDLDLEITAQAGLVQAPTVAGQAGRGPSKFIEVAEFTTNPYFTSLIGNKAKIRISGLVNGYTSNDGGSINSPLQFFTLAGTDPRSIRDVADIEFALLLPEAYGTCYFGGDSFKTYHGWLRSQAAAWSTVNNQAPTALPGDCNTIAGRHA